MSIKRQSSITGIGGGVCVLKGEGGHTADGLQLLKVGAGKNPGINVWQQPRLLHHHPARLRQILLKRTPAHQPKGY